MGPVHGELASFALRECLQAREAVEKYVRSRRRGKIGRAADSRREIRMGSSLTIVSMERASFSVASRDREEDRLLKKGKGD
jgi:hypothetical protein